MIEEPEQSSIIESSASIRKHAIRRRFLESIVEVLAVLIIIAMPISLMRIPQTGLHPNHLIHIIIGIIGIAIFIVRRKISDRWLIAGTLFTFITLSVSALLQYGMVSAGLYFAAAAIFITSLALGLRAGMICTGILGVIITIVAYLWISGRLTFPGDVGKYILLPSVWATLGVAFLITTAILYISAAGFFNGLNELVDTVEMQKLRIEERTAELTQANLELEEALKDIKTLSGLLPICSNCKKIRDDQGYWQQVDKYLQHHSEITFSHGLCPDCIEVLYPDIAETIQKRMKKG